MNQEGRKNITDKWKLRSGNNRIEPTQRNDETRKQQAQNNSKTQKQKANPLKSMTRKVSL